MCATSGLVGPFATLCGRVKVEAGRTVFEVGLSIGAVVEGGAVGRIGIEAVGGTAEAAVVIICPRRPRLQACGQAEHHQENWQQPHGVS